MGMSLFLNKFINGEAASFPFREAFELLWSYAEPGPHSTSEIIFPPDRIADYASIDGDDKSGATMISFNRPSIDDEFRGLVFKAMQEFGLTVCDDMGTDIYILSGGSRHLPHSILEDMVVSEIASSDQLWPADH